MISVIGSAGLIGYKIYEESQPVDQVKQTPLFPNGEKENFSYFGFWLGCYFIIENLDTTLYNVVIVSQETISFSPHCYHQFLPVLLN